MIMKLNLNIPKSKFILATSGGIDSLALAFMLKEQEADFISVIVDHRYRKISSEEAKQVKKLLEKNKINAEILTYKGKKPEKNIEEELRNIRYGLLTEYAKKNNIDTIVTAHHLDDNIETFLMRLARGSGVKGLGVMQEESAINSSFQRKLESSQELARLDTGFRRYDGRGVRILRPLLNVSKLELKKYLEEKKIKWFEDETNKDKKLTRNNLRDILEKTSDYEVLKKNLVRTINSISEVNEYVEMQVQEAFERVFIPFVTPHKQSALRGFECSPQQVRADTGGINHFFCNHSEFTKLHKLIAINILYKIFDALKFNDKDLRYDEVQNAYKNIIDGKESFTLCGVEYLKHKEVSYFFKEFARIKEVHIKKNNKKYALKPLDYEGLKKVSDKAVKALPKKVARTIMFLDYNS